MFFPRLSPKSSLPLIFCLLAVSAGAQKSNGGNRSNGPRPSTAMTSTDYKPMSGEAEFSLYDVTRRDTAAQQKLKNEQPPCFQWPLNPVLSNTVSAGRLDVPANARDEFIEGCAAAHKKDLAAAHQHLERAVKAAPKFAAAWTLLGQVEKIQGRKEEALRSCTSAREGDPSYLPGYLCLADLAARDDRWDQVANLTNHVIETHPVRAPGAYYYNLLASFYLKQWEAGEKSGLRSLEEGPKEYQPQVRWLLAKIYEGKGDQAQEAEQLREYLKLAPNSPDAETARHILQQIESKKP